MAEGWSTAAANAALDDWITAYPYAQLHTGAPGGSGTSNVATENTRKSVTASSASSGAITSTAALTWTSVAGSEDYTHISQWSASTSGNFGGSGTITANAVTAGDTFTIAIGDWDASLPVAS